MMAEDGERITFHWECGCPCPGEYPHIYVHTDSTNWTQRIIDFTKGRYGIGRKKYGGSMLSWKEKVGIGYVKNVSYTCMKVSLKFILV